MTEIKYNGSVVANFEGGNTATLPVKDKKMKSDIIITVSKAENGKPIEIDTLDNSLLTAENDGKVYKCDDKLYQVEKMEESNGWCFADLINPTYYDGTVKEVE